MTQHVPTVSGFQEPKDKLFPKLILLAMTSPCNARCPYCPSEVDRKIRETPGLDGHQENWLRPEYYRAVADQCVQFGARMRLSSYGETMLHPQLVELVEYSCDKGIPTSIITNGSCFTVEKIERLIRCGVESVEVSMETHDPELYKKLKVGLDFNEVLTALKTVRAIRDLFWADPAAHGIKSGARRAKLIVSIVRQPANPIIQETQEFFRDIADHVSIRSYLTWGLVQLQTRNPQREFYMGQDAPCPYPYERCMVDPAGYIRLCPYDDQKKIPPFGHVAQDAISDIWQGQRWDDIRSCHGIVFDPTQAKTAAPLCEGCGDRRNRSWTYNYESIVTSSESPR